jgi:hypothetical protein
VVVSIGYNICSDFVRYEGVAVRKLALFIGMAIGFVAGSWAGRDPYERLQGAFRQSMKQPKVQASMQSVTDSVAAVRDATLDATTGVLDGASKRFADESLRMASKVSQDS